MSYNLLVNLAGFPISLTPSVIYKRGKEASGILAPGQSVEICDGMHFTVAITGNA